MTPRAAAAILGPDHLDVGDLAGLTSAPLKHAARQVEDANDRRVLIEALRSRSQAGVTGSTQAGFPGWSGRVTRVAGVGIGLDERSVELPLALSALSEPGGHRLLDAGAALNHEHLIDLLPDEMKVLHVTQSADREPLHPDGDRRGYLFADLRDLPLRDGWFDRVACISTLEHVGMDNARYGGAVEDDPGSALAAARELVRVLAPGGTLIVTVPFGRQRSMGWFRVFGPDDLTALQEALAPCKTRCRILRYAGSWFESAPEKVVGSDGDDAIIRGVAVIRARAPRGRVRSHAGRGRPT